MKYGFVTALVGAIFFPVTASATELTQVERVQEALDTWLAARAPIDAGARAACCHRQWETDPPGTLNLTPH